MSHLSDEQRMKVRAGILRIIHMSDDKPKAMSIHVCAAIASAILATVMEINERDHRDDQRRENETVH
jgi:hypothetical protein